MLYLINGKYYVNTSPMIYTEVIISENNGVGELTPTKNKIEVNQDTEIKPVDFNTEVAKLKAKKPMKETNKELDKTSYEIKPRHSRYNR